MPVEVGEAIDFHKSASQWDYLGKRGEVPARLRSSSDLAKYIGEGAFVDVVEIVPRLNVPGVTVETMYVQPGQNDGVFRATPVDYADGELRSGPNMTLTAEMLGAQDSKVHDGCHAFVSRQPVAQAAAAVQSLAQL